MAIAIVALLGTYYVASFNSNNDETPEVSSTVENSETHKVSTSEADEDPMEIVIVGKVPTDDEIIDNIDEIAGENQQ